MRKSRNAGRFAPETHRRGELGSCYTDTVPALLPLKAANRLTSGWKVPYTWPISKLSGLNRPAGFREVHAIPATIGFIRQRREKPPRPRASRPRVSRERFGTVTTRRSGRPPVSRFGACAAS